jgi:hypothetical protein
MHPDETAARSKRRQVSAMRLKRMEAVPEVDIEEVEADFGESSLETTMQRLKIDRKEQAERAGYKQKDKRRRNSTSLEKVETL